MPRIRNDEYCAQDFTGRVIIPIDVYQQQGKTYVKAFCGKRNAERTFRLGRIIGIEMV